MSLNIDWIDRNTKKGIKIIKTDNSIINLSEGDIFKHPSIKSGFTVKHFGWGSGNGDRPRSIYFYAVEGPNQTQQDIMFQNNEEFINSIYKVSNGGRRMRFKSRKHTYKKNHRLTRHHYNRIN